MFEELGTILRLESDYAHEARCMRTYRERLADDLRFEVPQDLPELSSSRVLTMTWLDGQAFGPWMSGAPSVEARTRVARALLDLYCREFFDWGFVQTDPNPGNFLILEGGSGGASRLRGDPHLR